MTTFCLIHSSGQGPRGWDLLTDQLERRGHRTLAPAFQVDRTEEGLSWHADTVLQALDDSGCDPENTICVAHSAGGMYLPLIAEQWKPCRMVFLAAVVPRPGMSVREQFLADPSMFNPAWVGMDPRDEQVALDFVFHDCPPDRLDWAMATRVHFYAKRAMEEACPLADWPSVPASYIACLEDRTISPVWQCRAARELLGIEPIELPGGHCPNVSRPDVLAETLDRISKLS